MAGIKRNLESGGGIYINKFQTGVYKQRSPLFTPVSAMGVQLLSRMDTLWDGLNVEISPKMTLVRRFGYSRYCSAQFGVSDFPQAFYSFKNLSGTIKAMVDTPTKLYWFDSTSQTAVFTKTSTAQLSMQKVGSTLYVCNGNDNDAKKWDGTTVSQWGIDTPVTAPTLSFSAGSRTILSGCQYGYVYRNSTTGHVSTMSPASAGTGPQTSKNVTVQGASSTDAQVDKVDIYRTEDGGSTYFFLAEVVNGGTWSFTDSLPDTSLNTDIEAPVDHANDPPPSGVSVSTFHMGRFWVASGSTLNFAGGPDTTNGVPEEAFPPANNFQLPDKITAMASMSMGLLVFTVDDAYVVLGNDTASFYIKPWQKNFGVPSQNALVQDGDLLFIYTNKGQMFQIDSTNGLQEIGFPIQAQLGAFTPANVYVALHRSGADEGIFVSDGSTNVWRFSIAMGCWSTVAQPVGGVKCLSSIEVTTGNYRLMMGRPTASGFILSRDTTSFVDDGSAYAANVVIGSLIVAPPRQTAKVESILLEAMPVGTYPTVSVLLDEISGAFTALPNPVPDPPMLAASSTVLMKRHDLKAAKKPLPQNIRHLQIQIAFATEAAQNEVLGIAVD